MKLYRIRDKTTGKCLYYKRQKRYGYTELWTANGVSFRKLGTILRHLEQLKYIGYIKINHRARTATPMVKCDKKRLNNLEVVILENNQETIIEAKKFR